MCVYIFMRICKCTHMDSYKYKYMYTCANTRHRGDVHYCFNRILKD